MKTVQVFLIFYYFSTHIPHLQGQTCGLESCNVGIPGMLNVHLIPHTHDDVGWLKTVDQYYYGSKSSIQKAGVQYILDSVITELPKDPSRRFIYVESSFLWQWFQDQDENTRLKMIELIESGQLEIIGGGWSMNDEAVTLYQAIIDQMTLGLKKLNETFGPCAKPHIGWQIDPFGHSREMASLFRQMGYDGLFLARLDYQDKNHRLATRTMEMIWKGSNDLGSKADIFTTALYNEYAAPPGFCFDVTCNDEPFIDSEYSPDNNVEEKVQQFIDYVNEQAQGYNTNNILLTMGEDFHYQEANMWYKNLDKLIRYVNAKQAEGSNINVLYSTPSCYLKAVKDASPVLVEKLDDFFPYASDPNTYWTGYFTSRPTSKYLERKGNNFLQVCKQLHVFAALDMDEEIENMRRAMGIMQHHDAITGTEKTAVFQDYTRLLVDGFDHCGTVINQALINITTGNDSSTLQFTSCLMQNVSQCNVSENFETFLVTVYNPMSHEESLYVRLPVLGNSYSVRDAAGNEQTLQLLPIAETVLSLPERTSQATYEILFLAKNLPAMGFRSYYVTRLSEKIGSMKETVKTKAAVIGNENFQVSIDETTGLVSSITNNGTVIPLKQNFYYYEGFVGPNNPTSLRSSGAYIFRPNGSSQEISQTTQYEVYSGELVEEIHQNFSDWVSQVIRVYKDENYAEFEWLVGPIPISDNIGKEVVSLFTSSLNSGDTFYTDSNGRQVLERKINHRPTWNLEVNEPISGNYYPIVSKISIKDAAQGLEMAVLPDRSQGGSSLRSGEIEIMVHRRLLHDDGKGVGEALNETAFGEGLYVKGSHFLVVGPTEGNGGKGLAVIQKEIALRKRLAPWILLAPAEFLTFEQWSSKYISEYSGLNYTLTSNVQTLTLEPWDDRTILLRLEHLLESGDDINLSQPVTVNLQNLFSSIEIGSVYETNLAANEFVSGNLFLEDSLSITIGPMEIRTFLVEIL